MSSGIATACVAMLILVHCCCLHPGLAASTTSASDSVTYPSVTYAIGIGLHNPTTPDTMYHTHLPYAIEEAVRSSLTNFIQAHPVVLTHTSALQAVEVSYEGRSTSFTACPSATHFDTIAVTISFNRKSAAQEFLGAVQGVGTTAQQMLVTELSSSNVSVNAMQQ